MSASGNVPFFDYRAIYEDDPAGFDEVFRRTVAAGQIILQKPVENFEQALKEFLGCRHVVGLSDCTNAMTLGLRALGLAPGDEVILCSHTFLATAQAIHFAGGTPVPVEMQADRTIDPDAVEAAITSRTRAIMPTDLNGRTCDMTRLEAIAAKHGVALVTDSAQALGSSFAGRRAGTFGRFGTFSFYPSKLLGGFGDAGALATNDDQLADRVRRMRNHGANAEKIIEPDYPQWGTNNRLDTLHAAILLHKMERFPATLARRRQIARTYQSAFEEIADLGLPPGPDVPGRHFDVFQNYEVESGRRNALRRHLSEQGIGTIIQWAGTPVHRMKGLGFAQNLPRTDAFFERCFLLPMNQYLNDADVLRVCSAVRAYFGLGPWHELAPRKPEDVPAASASEPRRFAHAGTA
jgi:dTDP-4-amino-4,6-dideoxygalactose transaminase